MLMRRLDRLILPPPFADANLSIAPLARAVLEAGLDGAGAPQVTAPVPWLISVLKATGSPLPSRSATSYWTAPSRARSSPPFGVLSWPRPSPACMPSPQAWPAMPSSRVLSVE